MPIENVDYEEIYKSYDTGKSMSEEDRLKWINIIQEKLAISSDNNLLEIGCGTGRFTSIIKSEFKCNTVGLDPSIGMLKTLNSKSGGSISTIRGVGENIPFEDDSFQLIFMSSVIHHFSDINKTFKEAYRILNIGGMIGIRVASHDQMKKRLDIMFFKSLLDVYLNRPDINGIVNSLLSVGFSDINVTRINEKFINSSQEYIQKLEAKHSSAFTLLSTKKFETGLNYAKEYYTNNPFLDEHKHEGMTFLVAKKSEER